MKKSIKNIFIILLVTILIIIASLSGFIAYLQHFAKTGHQNQLTVSRQLKQEKLITINHGESLRHIASKLETSSLITNRHLFMILARYKGDNKKIKAGEYAFSDKDTPEKILDMLVKGKVKLHRITIPEGLNIREIAAIVEKAGFGTGANFIRLASDRDFISSLGINNYSVKKQVSSSGKQTDKTPNIQAGSVGKQTDKTPSSQAESLEGYLFPETYLFPAGTDQKKIISNMVELFNKVFIQDWRDICRKLGFTVHEIVTLASIIEKETANPAERPLISSVFHNRLELGMRLESDPTVIYGIPDFNGNITKKNLQTVTPYNTYAIYGLPAGPIANPGALSLQAAIFPQKSDFIFFVSKNDTAHQFSRTLQEHNLAVRKYQLKQ